MSVWQVIAALRRRWHAGLLAVLVVGGLVLTTIFATRPVYTVTSAVLLMPPSTSVPEGGNPFLALGGLDVMASVASRALTDSRSREEVAREVGKVDYTVDLDPASPAPLIQVVVEAHAGATATEAERFLRRRLLDVIGQLQDEGSVPARSRVTTIDVVTPTVPQVSHKKQLRLAVVVGVLSTGGSLLLVLIGDALLMSRSLRKEAELMAETPLGSGTTTTRTAARHGAGHRG